MPSLHRSKMSILKCGMHSSNATRSPISIRFSNALMATIIRKSNRIRRKWILRDGSEHVYQRNASGTSERGARTVSVSVRTTWQVRVSARDRTAVLLRVLYMVCCLRAWISADQEEISRGSDRSSGSCEYFGLHDLAGQHMYQVCDAGHVFRACTLCGDI